MSHAIAQLRNSKTQSLGSGNGYLRASVTAQQVLVIAEQAWHPEFNLQNSYNDVKMERMAQSCPYTSTHVPLLDYPL